MRSRYLFLAIAAAITCNTATAQYGLHITGSRGAVQWPPASTIPMSATVNGNFHVAIMNLSQDYRFCFADYDGSSAEPSRLGPMGNRIFPHWRNSVYEMNPSDQVLGTVDRAVYSNADMGAMDLWTDRARYSPGETVWIQAARFADFPGATVRYRHGLDVIKEEPLRQEWWPWNPPATDFQGYLVDVYRLDADGNEVVLASIGVDVSSDWKRFPRYGYTAWFEPGKEQYIPGDVAFLNRRHINAVQFQDWHWKHHRPYCADEQYTDVANRTVSRNVVKTFIEAQHGYNMVSFFYNLGFGALDGDWAEAEGVRPEWYYYKDNAHQQKDYHMLPSDWKSNISFMDPGNTGWQNYLCDRNEEVYANLPFDGFQVDQVGRRQGQLYDYWGNKINLDDRFAPMLKAFKQRHPHKRLIMNSVSKYGASQIASSGVIDVCYSELWDENPDMMDLYWVIFDNKNAGGPDMRTVFATYMNYDYAKTHKGGNFNHPGILLTDACIFALGASHLELGTGGNMLCNEYFPNTDLRMSKDLENAVTRYYDFATAYENYLYDTSRELTPTITSLSGHSLSIWNYQKGPQPRRITIHAKETTTGARVYHLLNFTSANSLSWRDLNGDMPSPSTQNNISLDIDSDRMVSRVWVATPDSHACAPVLLPFTQQGRSVTVTVPTLEYWTMLVLE